VLLLGVQLAAVACHLETGKEQGSGNTDGGNLEPDRFPDEEEVNYSEFSASKEVMCNINMVIADTANIGDFFEGDIILTPNQWKQMVVDTEEHQKGGEEGEDSEGDDIHKRAVVRDSAYRWPNAVVPYVISSNLRKYVCYQHDAGN
jgi:hypothetical protein